MKKIYLTIIVFLFALVSVFAETSKESVYQELVKKYGKISSVSLKYILKENKDLSGILKAKHPNKYFLIANDRTIISNGQVVWNYSPNDKKVVISILDHSKNSLLSLENFFFNFIKLYKPVDLSKETNSGGGSYFLLTLQPADKNNSIGGIKQAVLRLEPHSFNIRAVRIETTSNIQSYDISDLVVNPKIPDKTFEFTAPPKTEVIDLR